MRRGFGGRGSSGRIRIHSGLRCTFWLECVSHATDGKNRIACLPGAVISIELKTREFSFHLGNAFSQVHRF